MSTTTASPNTPNNQIGGVVSQSGPVILDTPFQRATWIVCSHDGTSGYIVYRNNVTKHVDYLPIAEGQWVPVACDELLTTHTFDYGVRTTDATGLFWAASAANLGEGG